MKELQIASNATIALTNASHAAISESNATSIKFYPQAHSAFFNQLKEEQEKIDEIKRQEANVANAANEN